jgi:N-acetyl-anhydromuramyl-L-alanine amidase AmpD
MQDIRATIPTTNYGKGRTVGIDTIVFHHIVGDAAGAIARFRQSGVQVSSTYIIGSDGQVYYTVSEANTPYTNGNYQENSRSITIEHAGGHSTVPYTEAMYRASINLVRDIRSRHNITRFLRHKDIVATACPGGLDVERIIRESNPLKGDNMATKLTRDIIIREYTVNRGSAPSEKEIADWLRSPNSTLDALSYGFQAENASVRKQLADVKQALANEQAKPPKEVIKTVEKIVERVVEKPIPTPVYVQDEETRENTRQILKLTKTIRALILNLFKRK